LDWQQARGNPNTNAFRRVNSPEEINKSVIKTQGVLQMSIDEIRAGLENVIQVEVGNITYAWKNNNKVFCDDYSGLGIVKTIENISCLQTAAVESALLKENARLVADAIRYAFSKGHHKVSFKEAGLVVFNINGGYEVEVFGDFGWEKRNAYDAVLEINNISKMLDYNIE
jgi:hypothetical protein